MTRGAGAMLHDRMLPSRALHRRPCSAGAIIRTSGGGVCTCAPIKHSRLSHYSRQARQYSSSGAATSGTAQATQPFTVLDLVTLERISEPAVSPDGKRVAYTLRSTDMEANKGRTGIWLLEAHKRKAPEVRLTDLAANSHSAEWSADGRFIYYLSNRSGSTQVWRVAAGAEPHGGQATGEPLQITNLPLDVGSFRISPKADRAFVSLEVYPDCADLACTKRRLDTAAHAQARGVLYDKIFMQHWDAWSDGRRSQLFAIALDAAGLSNGTPVNLTGGIDGDVPSKPFGGREDYAISPDGLTVAFSVRAAPVGEPWSTNFDIYVVAASGGTARNLTADNPAWDRGSRRSRPTVRCSLTSPPTGRDSEADSLSSGAVQSAHRHQTSVDPKLGSLKSIARFCVVTLTARRCSRRPTIWVSTPLWAIDASTGRAAAITGERYG